jgi:NitT/TauT family transport system ATP-binding protein
LALEIVMDCASKTFITDDDEEVRALEPVSLTVRAGEFLSLVGPSGCGKTTLLRMVAGLLPITSGEIRVGDRRVTQPDRRLSLVFQKPTLLPWRTILQNCLLPNQIMHNRTATDVWADAGRLLELTGLTAFRDRYPSELSGGMQQRAAIVRALISTPEVLLMDEPFSALDEFTRENLNEELSRIQARTRTTVIFVTHNISEAVFLSHRIGVMAPRPGRLGAVIEVPFYPDERPGALRKEQRFFDKVGEVRAAFEGLLQ